MMPLSLGQKFRDFCHLQPITVGKSGRFNNMGDVHLYPVNRLHTGRSVHFHPGRCARPSFSIFRGSGSETRIEFRWWVGLSECRYSEKNKVETWLKRQVWRNVSLASRLVF